jgi:hypothetical protein
MAGSAGSKRKVRGVIVKAASTQPHHKKPPPNPNMKTRMYDTENQRIENWSDLSLDLFLQAFMGSLDNGFFDYADGWPSEEELIELQTQWEEDEHRSDLFRQALLLMRMEDFEQGDRSDIFKFVNKD